MNDSHFLFLFLDGVGLGINTPDINPFVAANLPVLEDLLGGSQLVKTAGPRETEKASLLSLDAGLGIVGLPQSATGQAVLLTGRNVPAEIGQHYGPKPNPAIKKILQNGNLFKVLHNIGYQAALLNAYPEGYFKAIESGKRIYSAIPLAVTSADIPLKTALDLYGKRAVSADFTGLGWHEHLGYQDSPIWSPYDAGYHLGNLAKQYEFAFFEYWLSDYIGHKQDFKAAIDMLEMFDKVLGGLLESWESTQGLILLTSDHGNLEDLSTRRHTNNNVPGLVIGMPELRRQFGTDLHDLTGIAPAILRFFGT